MPTYLTQISGDDLLWTVSCPWSAIHTLFTDQAAWEAQFSQTLPSPFSLLFKPPFGNQPGSENVIVQGIETTPYLSVRGKPDLQLAARVSDIAPGDLYVTIRPDIGLAYMHLELGVAAAAGEAAFQLACNPYQFTMDAIQGRPIHIRIVSGPTSTVFNPADYRVAEDDEIVVQPSTDPNAVDFLYVGPVTPPCTVCEIGEGEVEGEGPYYIQLDTYVIKAYCPTPPQPATGPSPDPGPAPTPTPPP